MQYRIWQERRDRMVLTHHLQWISCKTFSSLWHIWLHFQSTCVLGGAPHFRWKHVRQCRGLKSRWESVAYSWWLAASVARRNSRGDSTVVVFVRFFLLFLYNTLYVYSARGSAVKILGSPRHWDRQYQRTVYLIYQSLPLVLVRRPDIIRFPAWWSINRNFF